MEPASSATTLHYYGVICHDWQPINNQGDTAMTTATDTPTITAQECFDNAAAAVKADDISKAMAWKDIGDGLVRLDGLRQADRHFTNSLGR